MSNNSTLDLSADPTAVALRETIRAAVRGESKYDAHVAAHGADLDVKQHAAAIAALAYTPGPITEPKRGEDGEVVRNAAGKITQQRTKYGRAVNTAREGLVAAVKRATADDVDDTPKPVVLRATLSGKGGGSVTIPADHPLHAQIVALIAEGK